MSLLPGVASVIELSCTTRQKLTVPLQEPMIPTPYPATHWERVAADLFELRNCSYSLVADYYLRFLEVQKLTATTSSNTVGYLKATFSRFEILIIDNGPQFDSQEIKKLADSYEFKHATISPYYPQANGLAERLQKNCWNIQGIPTKHY